MNGEQHQLLASAGLQVMADAQMMQFAGRDVDLARAVRERRTGDFSESDVIESLRILENLGGLSRSKQGITSGFIRVDRSLISARFMRASVRSDDVREGYSLVYEFDQFGSDWLDTIWHDYFRSHGKAITIAESDLSEAVPASDRIVRLDDNQPAVNELRNQASTLVRQLDESNDLGLMTQDERKIAAAEVSQLATALREPIVRLSTIADLATRTLKWIGEKAAGAAVGKAAIALLALIASFFGFSI